MVRRLVGFAGTLVLAVSVLSFSMAAPAGADGAEAQLSRQFQSELAAERTARGLAPLAFEPGLAAASEAWAGQLLRSASLRHSSDGRVEIIGVGPTTASITSAWIASTAHRNIVLDPNLSAVGVGVRCGADGQVRVVAQFAQVRVGAPSPSTRSTEAVVNDATAGSCASPLGVSDLVRRLYLAFLGRPADPAGLATYSQLAVSGHPVAALGGSLAASPEFQAGLGRVPSPAFVAAAYRSALGREPDAAGQAFWTGVLQRQGRVAVLVGIAGSPELGQRLSRL